MWQYKVGYVYTLPHGGAFRCASVMPNGYAMMETTVAMERDDQGHANWYGIEELEYSPTGYMRTYDRPGAPMRIQREIAP